MNTPPKKQPLHAIPKHKHAKLGSQGIFLLLGISLISCNSGPGPEPKGEREKYSYAIGTALASELAPQSKDIDLKLVHQALDDELKFQASHFSLAQAQEILSRYQTHRAPENAGKQTALREANIQQGLNFLARNSKRPSVVTTASGLQYEVLSMGRGPKPSETSQVTLHYVGKLIDGTEFESSYEKSVPANLSVAATIPGWREILQLMPVGSKYRVYLPGKLAFGDQGMGLKVGPQSTVIYDIELLALVF